MSCELLIPIGIILVLILMSAFFSGSETALTAASKARLHSWAKAGNKRAKMVQGIRGQKDRMIGALLLGNNLVNILASALATSVMIKVFGDAGVVYATMVMTILVLIFAEVLPKTYALHAADKMSLAIAPIIRVVIILFSPGTELVTRIVRRVLKLFGVDTSMVSKGSHMEVLRGAIELHAEGEDTTQEVQEQRAMLHSILDLADVDLEDIMTHRRNVVMIDAALPLEEIVRQVLDCPYTRLPIWKGDNENIIGVIHVKALLKELQASGGEIKNISIEDLASEPWFVPENTTLFDQLQAFRQRREHFSLVVDEYGSFMGIVTLEDILEEIVGEIDDEHDIAVAGVRYQPNGTLLVDGDVTIRDLNREFDWTLPDEEYSTLAGLILHEAQMVPDAGQSFNFFRFRFDVLRRQRNQITLIRVTPPVKEKESV